MKKNGFTLVEILAVLVLVAAIAIISVPSIINYINGSKNEISEVTKNIITTGTDLYVENYKSDYKPGFGHEYCVLLKDVVDSGFLEAPLIDSVSGEEIDLNKYVKITYDYDSNLGIYITNYEITNECSSSLVICSAVSGGEVTLGTIPTGTYEYGDEYRCELGDGEIRAFYVLEDGDDTGLTKIEPGTFNSDSETVGITGLNEVTLIMDENYDNATMLWCLSGDDAVCNADGLESKLNNIRSAWTSLSPEQINLPTYAQVFQAGGNKTFSNSKWLYNNLDNDTSTDLPYGYWTSTAHGRIYANLVNTNGGLEYSTTYADHGAGVRPVITISKDLIKN